jgi:hypothetical protein
LGFTAYDAAVHTLRRAKALAEASLTAKGTSVMVRTDLRRLSVVMAVAALDTYIHTTL